MPPTTEANNDLVFTVADLRAIVEPDLGPLKMLTIHRPDPPSGRARWTGVTEDAEVVEGEIEITMTSRMDGNFEVVPRVSIQGASNRMLALPWSGQPSGAPRHVEGGQLPRQLVEDRLREISVRLRRVITMIRTQPGIPGHEMATELGEIVDLAEGGG